MLFSCIDDLMFTVLSSCGPLWYCLSNVVESRVFVVLASSGCHGARHCPASNASSPALDRLQPRPRPPAPPPTPSASDHLQPCPRQSCKLVRTAFPAAPAAATTYDDLKYHFHITFVALSTALAFDATLANYMAQPAELQDWDQIEVEDYRRPGSISCHFSHRMGILSSGLRHMTRPN